MTNRGVYVLWLFLAQKTVIEIGRLGTFAFEEGVYAYCGSAQQHLRQRVERHSRLDKTLHWHIDYFRAKAQFLGAVLFEDQDKAGECWLVEQLLRIPGASCPVARLGSSDCRCPAHLVYVPLARPRLSGCVERDFVL